MRIDPIAQAFMLIAGAIIVYLAPYGIELFTPLALLVVAVSLLYMIGKKVKQDTYVDPSEGGEIGKWTFIGVIAIIGCNIIGVELFGVIPTTATVLLDLLLFGILYAIVEEIFFRGLFFQFFLSSFKNFFLAIMISAGVFLVYHFKVYGTSPEKMFVILAGGVIISFIAWRTRRLSPCILIHVINNVIAVLWS